MVQVQQRRDGYTPLASHYSQLPHQTHPYHRLHQKQRMAQAIAMLPKPPTYCPQFYYPSQSSSWQKAPGAERRSIDLSTLPPPPIDLQAQANAHAFVTQQQAIATANERALQQQQEAANQQQQAAQQVVQQQHQFKQQQNAVSLSGFAAEAIWDLCWSTSPAFGDLSNSAMTQSQPMHYRTPSMSVYAGGEDMYGRPKLEPTVEFRRWTYSILTQTALSKQALFLALYYASRLPIHSSPNLDSAVDSAPYRLLTISLALANRWLDDNTYTNKTWSEVTGLSLKDIGSLDMWTLVDQRLDVNVSTEEWTNWMYRIRAREKIYQENKMKGDSMMDTAVGYNEPKLVIAAVDECLRNQFKADYRHSVEFSKSAVAARHRYSPVADVPLVPVYDYGHIDLDQDGPLRQVHHTTNGNHNSTYMNIDGAGPGGYNMYMHPQHAQVQYEDESWGRMGPKAMPHYQPTQPGHVQQHPQVYYQQPTLGGGLGLGGFQLADYRRGVVA